MSLAVSDLRQRAIFQSIWSKAIIQSNSSKETVFDDLEESEQLTGWREAMEEQNEKTCANIQVLQDQTWSFVVCRNWCMECLWRKIMTVILKGNKHGSANMKCYSKVDVLRPLSRSRANGRSLTCAKWLPGQIPKVAEHNLSGISLISPHICMKQFDLTFQIRK